MEQLDRSASDHQQFTDLY